MARSSFLRQALASPLITALEEIADGQARSEVEHTLYARVTDFNFLNNAAGMEHQEQWEIKLPKTPGNAGSLRMRVRKVVKPGQNAEFFLTLKTVDPRNQGNLESTLPCTDAMFTQFKIGSEKGMIKDRYFFPVNDGSGKVYEVDMFFKDGAQPGSKDYYDWCKIDLEVQSLDEPLPPLPQGFTDIISAPFGKRSEADEARVTSLYHNEFTAKNQYL
jgi:hypothetical protein